MSDDKKPVGHGLFTNKRAAAGRAAAPAAASAPAKPKDVRKRWLYIGAGAVVLMVAVSAIMQEDPSARAPEGPQEPGSAATIQVTPPRADRAAFEAAHARDLETLKGQVSALENNLQAKDQQIRTLREQVTAGTRPPLPPGIVPPPGANTGGLGMIAPPGIPPAPPAPPEPPPRLMAAGAGAPPMLGAPSALGGLSPLVFDAPGEPRNETARALADAALPEAAARQTMRRNPNAGLIPAGAFAPISLLNGLDAGTSSATQTNPLPVLARITDHATLPGAARFRLKSCFILGTGFGDLSAERVYIRISRLSCVDREDRLVLSQEVQGYIVDSDGKIGMRGTVTDRQGARLGKALLAGFAQGLAGALGQAQSTVTTAAATGATTQAIGGDAALRAAGLQGAQAATSQLAEFYLREAQSIFPVISVDTGRTGTVVFTSSTPLNWGAADAQYVPEVRPANN